MEQQRGDRFGEQIICFSSLGECTDKATHAPYWASWATTPKTSSNPLPACLPLALHQHLFPLTCHEPWQLSGSEFGADSSSKRKISARWQQTASQNKGEGVRKAPWLILGNRLNHHVSSLVPWPSRTGTLHQPCREVRERQGLDLMISEVFSNLIESLILLHIYTYVSGH